MASLPKIFLHMDGSIYIETYMIGVDSLIGLKGELCITPYTINKNFQPKSFSILRTIKLADLDGSKRSYYVLPRCYGLGFIWKNSMKYNHFNDNFLKSGEPMKYNYLVNPDIELFDYQRDAIKCVIDLYNGGSFGGILKLPTSAGKTGLGVVLGSLVGKTLIVVKTKNIAKQWMDEIQKFLYVNVNGHKYAPNFAMISGMKKEIVENEITRCDFLICIVNSLERKITKFSYKTFESIRLVILDEIQNFQARESMTIFDIVSRRFIVGMSATPVTIKNIFHTMLYYVGPIIFDYSKSYKGTPPIINMLIYTCQNVKYKRVFNNEVTKKIDVVRMIGDCICKDPSRFVILIDLIKECLDDPQSQKILVIAIRKEILDKLQKVFDGNHGTYFVDKKYQGMTGLFYSMKDKESLNKMYNETLTQKKVILGIDKMASEGFNLKDCNRLILVNPKNVNIDAHECLNGDRLNQEIGRCLRRPWDEKSRPKIYILNDNYSVFINSRKRRMKYLEEVYPIRCPIVVKKV